jgi:hypothetical protein
VVVVQYRLFECTGDCVLPPGIGGHGCYSSKALIIFCS